MQTPYTLPTLSTEYIEVRVRPRDSTADPTTSVPVVALIIGPAKPVNGDWFSGSWRTGLSGAFYLRGLIGPAGTKSFTPGRYAMWIKFTGSPEIPARNVGIVIIT